MGNGERVNSNGMNSVSFDLSKFPFPVPRSPQFPSP